MDKRLFEKSKKVYITYDNIYRHAKKVSKFLFKAVFICLLLIFGFMGNVEFNPNASLKVVVIECIITMILTGIFVYFGNKYQNISEEYKEKAKREYIELLSI